MGLARQIADREMAMGAGRLITTGLLLGLCALSFAADDTAKPTDVEIASAYFEALTTGDVAKANELSTVPFSVDREAVLETKGSLEARHRAILALKGRRQVPKYKTTKPANAPAIDPKVFPGYTVVRIAIEDGKAAVDIYVSTGENPKVIGFSD